MEISFENKVMTYYREICRQSKRIQISAESVVPDTDEDIGRLASVHTSVMLKSKDLTGRGVLISGEAAASLLYITEDQQSVSFVRLTKLFTIEYEAADIDTDTVAQISLSVLNTEARVINPRKVSVTLELCGDLSCYKPEELCVESSLPKDKCKCLHARYDNAELVLACAACEKTFSISEQFPFPSGKPCPSRLVSQKVEFIIGDCQLIGRKLIIKGTAEIGVCYLSQEANYPVKAEFSTPFSQIVDIGEESMDGCTVLPELTSGYFELTDTINGEKALDTELHGVLQIVCRSRRDVSYVADAYSNLMPAECVRESCQYGVLSDTQRIKLSADERISIVDDCEDVLSAFVSIAHLSQEQAKLSASVNIDVVYRTTGGLLSSARRSVSMEGDCGSAGIRLLGSRLTDVYLRPDNQFIDGHISVELSYLMCSAVEISKVAAVSLDDESPYDTREYPTVTMVRAGDESLWELAKTYHSCVEKISEINPMEGELKGRMLLIPKTV